MNKPEVNTGVNMFPYLMFYFLIVVSKSFPPKGFFFLRFFGVFASFFAFCPLAIETSFSLW